MVLFELAPVDISNLNDADLRELVARLCEAELSRQGISSVHIKWGGAQEAPDGGLDVYVQDVSSLPSPGFVPRINTGIQVKKNSMSKAACAKEMQDSGSVKKIVSSLADNQGAYIIVSGKDRCSDKMLSDRISGMASAITGLPNKENLKLDFYCSDRLCNWLRQHPGVALWARIKLGKPLSGWKPFGRWTSVPANKDDELLLDDHPCVRDLNSPDKSAVALIDGIKLARDKLLNPCSAVRITGLSGVGKTRFAQALFEAGTGENVLSSTDVIYADLGEDLKPSAAELLTYLIANDYAAFVVLDNCNPDVHRQLQRQLSESKARLSLLTIEYDISDDKPEETDVIHLEPASEKTVSSLIQRRFPKLGQLNADRIAEFAGGNARVAIALANRVDADETLTKFSEEQLFKRLFHQGKVHSDSLLHNAEILSLVYSFNVSAKEFNDELSVLAKIGEVKRTALYKDQAELLRRQLVQQRGNWRAVLPHALANRLASRALENIAPDEINTELFKPENIRLLKSCAHRLGYLHDCQAAHELAGSWLQPGAPLHNIASCDAQLIAILTYIAPVFPATALAAIERACVDKKFASRKNTYFSTVVGLLCKLAYEDNMFDRAASVLVKFAETESKDENNDSIVNKLSQLFSLYLSGTQATPERRQKFLRHLHYSDNKRYQEIAEKLFSSAFEAYRWSSFGSFSFGARKRDWGWRPQTNADVKTWYEGFIEILKPGLEATDESIRNHNRSILSTNFRGLWSKAHCFETLENLITKQNKLKHWPEMLLAVKHTLHYNKKAHSPELLILLQSLEKKLTPSSFIEDLKYHLFFSTHTLTEHCEDEYPESYQAICKKIISFGEMVASQSEILEYFAPQLWITDRDSIWLFGKGLAQGSQDKTEAFNYLVSLMQKQKRIVVYPNLFAGFISAVYTENSEQAEQLQAQTLLVPELQQHFVYLLCSTPINQWGANKLFEVAKHGLVEASKFQRLSRGRIHETISDNDLAAILDAVSKLEDGIFFVIEILSMRFHTDKNSTYVPQDTLKKLGRTTIYRLLSLDKDNVHYNQLFGLDRIIEQCITETAPQHEVIEIIDCLCDGLSSYRLFRPDITKIILSLVKSFPELVLNRVFNGADRQDYLASRLFKDSFSRHVSYLNDVPTGRLLAWCNGDESRIQIVAKFISAYKPFPKEPPLGENPKAVMLTEHALTLIKVAQDKLSVANEIYEDISPSSWSGSQADAMETRLKAFADLIKHDLPEIRSFVQSKITILEQIIRETREREALRDTEREQRFE
ncbi:hypothetical protein Q3O60_00970 [Alkalimonas collagenimarina]|uniref:ATP-binding protein n=1 Tax=Alkalimonas collagenimarina TaxID=400390 RepID=A0ABT9GUN4_9GAMM|nr:hypothetical protein [Alkalimonas collagenimarina]MDP4534764.1 hypothetical protein [Alkalimonas collagenimarina]